MKSLFLISMTFCCLSFESASAQAIRLLVKTNTPGDVTMQRSAANLSDDVVRIVPLYPTAKNKSGRSSDAGDRYFIFELKDNKRLQDVRQYLDSIPAIEFVEQDAIGGASSVRQEKVFSNDPHLPRQWSHFNDGSFSEIAIVNADANITEAWTITKGSSSVIVAILDSGLKLDHEEFAGRLWTNNSEIPGNNLDDDGNGFVDDSNGWNMVDNNHNLHDNIGHGTHITGIVAANGNNAVGYAGVDWNCKIMTLKVLKDDYSGYYSWWAQAIHYAVDNGANVINMSLGGTVNSKILEDAVNYARSRNVLIVASMQNQNSEVTNYPAGYKNSLAVGATDPDDSRSISLGGVLNAGSNYGGHIDVVAPGNYIFGLSNKLQEDFDTILSGTSQAAPLVTGVASLLLSRSSLLSIDDLEQAIVRSAQDMIGSLSEDIPGWDKYYGYGRIDAYKALMYSETHDNTLTEASIYPNPSRETAMVHFDQQEDVESQITVFNAFGTMVVSENLTKRRIVDHRLPVVDLPSGVYFVRLKNHHGNRVMKWIVAK